MKKLFFMSIIISILIVLLSVTLSEGLIFTDVSPTTSEEKLPPLQFTPRVSDAGFIIDTEKAKDILQIVLENTPIPEKQYRDLLSWFDDVLPFFDKSKEAIEIKIDIMYYEKYGGRDISTTGIWLYPLGIDTIPHEHAPISIYLLGKLEIDENGKLINLAQLPVSSFAATWQSNEREYNGLRVFALATFPPQAIEYNIESLQHVFPGRITQEFIDAITEDSNLVFCTKATISESLSREQTSVYLLKPDGTVQYSTSFEEVGVDWTL